ncbi:MAG: TonB-dependent receptor domain-containing protein, partial [Terriglobales bacterium]
LGFSRAVAVDGGLSRVLNPAILAAGFSMVPGEFVGAIAVPGLTAFGGGPAADLQFSNSSKSFAWNSFQAYDDYAFSHGPHALQFGGMLERMQSNVGINSDANGSFAFGSLRDFLLNQPLTFDSDRAGPLGIFGIRETLLATYLQDAVQVRPGLSLSAGLRYEYTTVPTEAHDRLANLQHLTDASARLGEPYFLNPTVDDFSPRLGLSWQARANDLVESGFGIFDVLPLPYEFNIIVPDAYPYLQQFVVTTLPTGAFPTAAYALAASNPTLFRTTYIEHHPHRSYVMQWNLKLEHRLSTHGVLSLAYVGSRSVHLPLRSDDFNTVMPALTSAGYVYPPAASSQRLNPNFGRISGITWNADGYYNALQTSLTASRPWLQLQLSYTWGQSLDTGTATVTADQYDNSLVNMPWFNTRLNRGPSDLNIAQNLVVSGNWSVPAGAGIVSRLLGGWQLDQVFRASTGSPFTAELGGDPLGTKLSAVSEVPDVLAGPGCSSLVNPGNPNSYIRAQCFAFPDPAQRRGDLGRNRLTGPGLINLDMSAIKNVPAPWLETGSSVQFRAEFFNVFNRPDFASPLNHLAVFDSTGAAVQGAGLITSTV